MQLRAATLVGPSLYLECRKASPCAGTRGRQHTSTVPHVNVLQLDYRSLRYRNTVEQGPGPKRQKGKDRLRAAKAEKGMRAAGL